MKTDRALIAACWISMAIFLPRSPAAETTERKVSVSGTAVTRVVPDMVVWRLTTTDLHLELLRAKAESDAKLKAILALREGLGVAPVDVQTGYLSIHKEYDRDRSGNRGEFKGFLVTRTVTYTQRDLARFDEFLSKLIAAADVEVEFAFETSRRQAIREETRIQAVLAAREKAAAMTKALGAGLGRVLTIEEDRGSPMLYSNFNRAIPPSDEAAADIGGETFAPGSIDVRLTVHATFAIE